MARKQSPVRPGRSPRVEQYLDRKASQRKRQDAIRQARQRKAFAGTSR